MHAIETRGLTKRYGRKTGIAEVTFAVSEGEMFGFIGPNGAGKSTTIRTLLNLVFPTSGSATVFGMDIVRQSRDIRRIVGYLPAEVRYYDDMRVSDLLAYSAQFYAASGASAADMRRRAAGLAERLGLDLAAKIEDLSFGNRKKVGIVQALLHKPRLLVLDEPTAGLDPLVQNEFYALLREARAEGATVFFSSHVLSEVQKLCDRVAIIRQGRLVAVESVERLVRNRVKKVTLALDRPEGVELRLDGVERREASDGALTLFYRGDPKLLLDAVRELPFSDIRIEEPSLEEVFMHDYAREEGSADGSVSP